MTVSVINALISDIQSFITADDDLPNLAQINPVVANPAGTFPSLTFAVRDGFPDTFYRGSFDLTRMSVDLNLYSTNYTELQTLKFAILSRYNGFSGTLGTQTIDRIVVANSFDTFDDDPSTKVYRVIIELDLTYQ